MVGRPPAPDEVGRRRGPVRLAEQHEDLGPRSGGELEARLQGGARIHAGAGGSLQPVSAVQAGGPVRSAVAAEELGPIGRPRRLPPAEVEEGDPAAELGVPRVAHEERPRLRLQRRDDPGGAGPARGAQRPLGVGGHRQAPGAPGSVLDGQHRDLQGVVERDELDEVELDAVVQVLEPAVAGTVTGDVGRFLAADRLGRRTPQLAGVVVPDVDRLAHRVADRVVGPRGELVLAAVPGPGVARPGLGDLEPERRVGDHVQPRRRGRLSRAEDRDVLAPAIGEAAEPVEELQLRTRRGRLARWSASSAGGGCGRGDPLGTLQADDLVGEAAPAAQQDGPGGRLEERAVLGGELVAAQDVDPAVARMALVDQGGLARPHEGLERVLEVLGVGGAVLVEDHEVDVEELQPPVLVGAEQLPDDVEVLGLVDPHQDDGQVARDAVGPQAGRPALVAGQQARRRPQRRVRVEDPVGQALEEVGLVGLDPQVVELDLGLRPGQGRRPLEGGRLAVLVGQVQDLLARLGDDGREDRVGGRAGGEPDPAAGG